MPLLFSYGTRRREAVQLATFGRRLQGRSDALPGFELSSVQIDDPHVIAASGTAHFANVTFTGRRDSCVPGTVFEITGAELTAADEYEQRAAYQRIAALLTPGNQAWGYVDARTGPAVG
jgi:gamma-glutamylcyclotransferase (GGCT)/AIG2-like uncharacterized protein YtfP